MNSTNNNGAAATIDAIIQEAYANTVFSWLTISSTILVFYAALLKLPQETDVIWHKSFSLPTLLYIFARYGALAVQGLRLLANFIQSERACNIIIDAANSFAILAYIGVQGLLVARAYTLCQNKIIAVVLALALLSSLILQLYVTITINGCITSLSSKTGLVVLGINISLIFTDGLIFIICMWSVWGTWRLQHEAGIQNKHSLVIVLIKQSIFRCCFVVVITVTGAVLEVCSKTQISFYLTSQGFNSFQNALSSILVANFTLDLRSLNSDKIEASNISLPPLQFANVFQRVHQSIIMELTTPDSETLNDEEFGAGGHSNHDDSEFSNGIQPDQE